MNIHVHWLPLLPVIIPAVTAVLVLVIDAVVPRRRTCLLYTSPSPRD